MNIEDVREYCLSLPLATEDMPFDDTTLVLRIKDKIFVLVDLDRSDKISLKCDPEYAIDLRDRYPEIEGAWHMNKKYWNQVNLEGGLRESFIKELIRHSYAEVVKKLPKYVRNELPQITEIK